VSLYIRSDLTSAIQDIKIDYLSGRLLYTWVFQDPLSKPDYTAMKLQQAFRGYLEVSKAIFQPGFLIKKALGLPLSHPQTKEFAERILVTKEDHRPIGKHWM